MAQASYVPNVADTDAQALVFFQDVLAAIQTVNSGAAEPSETAAGMLWFDTSAGYIKQRSADNTTWARLVPVAVLPAELDAEWGWQLVETAYNSGTDGEVASVTPSALEDKYEYRFEIAGLGFTAGALLRMEVYGETAAAFSAPATLAVSTTDSANVTSLNVMTPTFRTASQAHSVLISGEDEQASPLANSVSDGAGSQRSVGFVYATAQKISQVRFSGSAGSINEGAIRVWRRRG